jgi:glycosyltransferase involved in cell wall biosynthesis
VVVIDGLALSAMPGLIERESPRLRIAALVHLPIAADVGLARDTAERLEAAERRALKAAALVIVTGTATLGLLERYGLVRGTVVVVAPGTDRAPLARGSGGSPVRLLSVATLNPGKGHDALLLALAAIPQRDWHLTCAGSLTRHPATVNRVRALARQLDLEDRVSLAGELDTASLAACYDAADVFVLATLQETYGMAVAEALAHGLPVVSTTTGAIPDLVGDDAGLLVPPGDPGALAGALARVIGDAGLRAQLAAGARQVRDRLPEWDNAAAQMADVLQRLALHD